MRAACSWLLLASAAAAAPREVAVLHESFTDAGLPGWTIDASNGNVVRVRDGVLEIAAAENSYAHIERPLGVDFIRATCVVQPGSGISWAASLFLYWAPGDWCQIGVIPRQGGRFYACVTTRGQRAEHDLTRCRFDAWQHVGIELGDDCVRFISSPDGQTWRTELLVERPATLTGPPALLIVGKGFGVDAGTPDLDGDYGDRGAVATARIRTLRVSATDPQRRRITDAERRAKAAADADPSGQALLALPGDPDFERVAAVFPPLAKPREVVGVREHPYEVGVDYDGAIQLADDTDLWEQTGKSVAFEVGDPPLRLGAAGWHKRLLEGYLPIVIAECEQDGLQYALLVLGYSEGLSTQAPLSAQIRLRVTNPGAAPRSVALRLVGQVGAPESRGATSKPAETVEPLTWKLTVPAGGAEVVCAQVASPLGTDRPHVLPHTEFDARLATATNAWRTLLNAGLRMETPESRVNDAARAWLAYSFLNVDNDAQGRSHPHDGAGFYEEVFGYSAALYCHALDLWGYHDAAGRTIESLLALQRDDGLFYVRYGLPDHGALLMAVCQHYLLTGDATWLRNVAPRLARLCEWVLQQRQLATSRPAAENDRLTRGLIRFAPYADYQGATYNYYADAYLCAGLEQAAPVLAILGHAEHGAAQCPHGSHGPQPTKYAALAQRVAREAAAYRADILASMTAATIERDGQRLLPIEPDTQRILKSTGYRGGGYYGLVASMLLESGFLPPTDPRAGLLVDALERRRGLILGMCEFDEGIDHAYTYGYWMNCLQRDEVRRVLLGFYGSLAYGMGRDTYCGVEVTQITTGEPTPTMPHLYSCTQQLRLLRMMLVREDGAVLRLGQAVPRPWLKAGQRVAVTRAPTAFGPVTYAIQMNAAGDAAEVRLEPPRRKPPHAIHVYLRHPAERAPRSAQLAGTGTAEVRGACVILTDVTGPVTLQVQW